VQLSWFVLRTTIALSLLLVLFYRSASGIARCGVGATDGASGRCESDFACSM